MLFFAFPSWNGALLLCSCKSKLSVGLSFLITNYNGTVCVLRWYQWVDGRVGRWVDGQAGRLDFEYCADFSNLILNIVQIFHFIHSGWYRGKSAFVHCFSSSYSARPSSHPPTATTRFLKHTVPSRFTRMQKATLHFNMKKKKAASLCIHLNEFKTSLNWCLLLLSFRPILHCSPCFHVLASV